MDILIQNLKITTTHKNLFQLLYISGALLKKKTYKDKKIVVFLWKYLKSHSSLLNLVEYMTLRQCVYKLI